jgi:hypothetical protein
MPSCSKQESDFEQAQQEFERAHAAREDIDAQIEKVGTDAINGVKDAWKCILASVGNWPELLQCAQKMDSEPEVSKKLKQLRDEGKIVQHRYETAVDELSSTADALADCLQQPPPPAPTPPPPMPPLRVPPAVKRRIWHGSVVMMHTE